MSRIRSEGGDGGGGIGGDDLVLQCIGRAG